MNTSQEPRQVTLSAPVRTFERSAPGSAMLSHHDQKWLTSGETYTLGPVQRMGYDRRFQDAAEVLNLVASVAKGIQRFVLMSEVEANLAK